MKQLRNYLLVLTLVFSALTFAACGNDNNNGETTSVATTTENTTSAKDKNQTLSNTEIKKAIQDCLDLESAKSNGPGMINDTTGDGVVGDAIDDVEEGVSDIIDGNDNNDTTKNNVKDNVTTKK